ncbi:ScbR family autoregulator-binding transcription factor [Streptomyces sp. NPDC048442]|uniref:ScbR family autoregulator-binding transcription factor n=1 Tax=Streptomyces sp. NPDC048442 TaxID=3154823 RepID=UPI003443B5E1
MVKQERAVRTRRALIEAAAEVFAEEGYVLASLTTISGRAGVSNGALHFHFKNKQALARAVEEEAALAVARIVEGTGAVGGGVLQELVDTSYVLMDRLAQDPVVRAGFELGGEGREGAGSCQQGWRRWVEEAVVRAEREGGLAEGVSSDAAACTIVAATVGFEVLGAQDPAWYAEHRIAGFWELLLPGLRGAEQKEDHTVR